MRQIGCTLLLCTVRWQPYVDLAGVDAVGKIVEDLSAQQNAPSFELVVVDGLFARRRSAVERMAAKAPFPITHIPPTSRSLWVRMKKVAICAYRNSGIAVARGELILNLDDCAVLPPDYVATFWRAWKQYNVALGMIWPHRNDSRRPGRVTWPGAVFGFGAYPRELAFALNGYDEAFDGSQGLEDADWSTRLFEKGLPQALLALPGFDILDQTEHDPEAIDLTRPIVRCCNASWNTERVWRHVEVANTVDLWPREALRRLVGPCLLLRDGRCDHHGQPCPYLDRGFPLELDPEAAVLFREPPVFDLRDLAARSR